jgi:hypothetical protein
MRSSLAWFVTLGALVAGTGGAAAEGAPLLMDTIGVSETEITVEGLSNSKPAWVPGYKFIVQYDGYDQNDVVLVQWKQGGKAIGKPAPCAAKAFVRETQVNPQTPMVPVNLAAFDCTHPKESAISQGGAFTLTLVYKHTLADKTSPLGTLEGTAIELKQGAQNKQISTWTGSHDHRLTGATVEENVNTGRDTGRNLEAAMLQHHEAERAAKLGGPTHYTIRFWTKYKQGGPVTMNMSCLLDGKPVVEANQTHGETRSYWTFKGKDKDNVAWAQQEFQFYKSRIYKQADEPGVWQWSEHPGEYRCVATSGGEIVKEVMFTIGADGKFVDSPCQAQIRTLRHIHLARTKDKATSNTPVDAKAAKKGYFGRVTWGAGCPGGK